MKENDTGSGVSFQPPKGFAPPSVADGKRDFDLVCTFHIEDDGRLTLTKLGDTPMGAKSEKEKSPPPAGPKTSKPMYGDYSQGLMSGMQGAGMEPMM